MPKESKKIVTHIESVERFATIFNYQLSTSVLMFLQGNWWIALPLLIIAAILFTPYMMYVLIREKRFGWIIAFFIIAILPFVLAYFFSRGSVAFEGTMIVPFAFFYFYCVIIRFSVNEWVKDYNWHIYYEEQRKETTQQIQDELV